MGHGLIVGRTRCGKSTLAREIAEKLREAGYKVLLFDPRDDQKWLPYADYIVTEDMNHYLEIAKQSRSCILIVDEAHDVCGHHDNESFWLATQARHLGHTSIFIATRYQQLAPNIRLNCDQLYMFKTGKQDAAKISEEFGDDSILDAITFKRGEYLYTNGFDGVKKGKVF